MYIWNRTVTVEIRTRLDVIDTTNISIIKILYICGYNINNFTNTQTRFFTRSITNITNNMSFTIDILVYIRKNKFNFNDYRKPKKIVITIMWFCNTIKIIFFFSDTFKSLWKWLYFNLNAFKVLYFIYTKFIASFMFITAVPHFFGSLIPDN